LRHLIEWHVLHRQNTALKGAAVRQIHGWPLAPAAAGVVEGAAEDVEALELLLEALLAPPFAAGAVCSGVSTGVAAGAGRVAIGMVESPAPGSSVGGAAMMVVGVPSISGDCADGRACSIGILAGIAVSAELSGGKTG
jgi:hypothetical protein